MGRDLLFELGCEDLPPMQIAGALDELANAFCERAAALRLEHGLVHTYATPRRLALLVEGLAESQRDLEETRVGPPVEAAYDKDGNPTRALTGFCRVQGVEPDALVRVTQEKKKGKPAEYVAAVVREPGRPTQELLGGLLAALPLEIHWPRAMRWGRCPQPFARPVHWILARFGSDLVELEFAGVRSGGTTRGHRFHAPAEVEVPTPGDYLQVLREARVLADISERRSRTAELAAQAVAAHGGGRLREDADLLDEIVQLVEWPVPIVGAFDEDYLELPAEVLITSMRKHQRYFSVSSEEGRMLPRFVTIANTEVKDPEVVAHGNLRVLRARLEDARFFYREDQKRSLEAWHERLARVTYVEGLGSVADKVERIVTVASWLAREIAPGDTALLETVERAAQLCKADLVTGMVQEFPELQGFVGGRYAANAGAPEGVARAIVEHYAPRGASDALPATLAGAIVSIADRIDSIAALFGLGRMPTGAADPFALRRAALGLIRIARERDLRVSLGALVEVACRAVEETANRLGRALPVSQRAHRDHIADFVLTRLRNLAILAHPTEVVDAVIAIGERLEDLPAAFLRIEALSAIRDTAEFEPIGITFKRVGNILGEPLPQETVEIDTSLFAHAEETELHRVTVAAAERLGGQLASRDFAGALETLIALRPTVDTFFDAVMVNADDEALRRNRHALLRNVLLLFLRVADVRRL